MKRVLRTVAISLAALALLFVGASAAVYALVDLDALVADQVERLKPALEEELGREIEVGAIHTRFFPTLGARIEGLEVAGVDGGEPLARVGAIGFDVNLLRAILSFGKRIELGAVYVDGLEARIERAADGTLSFQDILDRQARKEPAKDDGPSPKVLELAQQVSIGEVRVADASVVLVDRQTASGEPATSHIRRIDLRMRDVRLGDPIAIRLSGALFRDTTNLELAAVVGPLPADLALDGLPRIADLKLHLDQVNLGPLSPYLPREMPAKVESAVVSADWEIPELANGRPVQVAGFLAVDSLRLQGGDPFELRLDARLRADPGSASLRIDEAKLRAAGMEVTASGALENLSTEPRFQDFSIATSGIRPARILAIFPAAGAGLPEGARIDGAMALSVDASGDRDRQTFVAKVDLGGLDLFIPGAIAKPAGTAFSFAADGELAPGRASLRGARLQLDELLVEASGTVENFAAPRYDFHFAAPPFSFDRLVRLMPRAGEELRKAGATADGSGSLKGHLKGAPGSVDFAVDLGFDGMRADLPSLRVEGSARARAAAKGDPAGDLSVDLLVDAGSSVIRAEGAMDKAAGTPLLVDVAARRQGSSFRFDRFDVRLADLRMTATGALAADGTGDLTMRVHPVDLEKLALTFPAIPGERVKGGSLEAEVGVSGDPSRLATVSLDLRSLRARLGRSDLSVQATVRNLEAPDVTATVRSSLLDLDALRGVEPAKPEDPPKEPPADDPELRKYRFRGDFRAGRLVMGGRTLDDVVAKVRLEDGELSVEQATFRLYGGSFSANGSRASIWRGRMPFHAKLSGSGMDVGRMIEEETGRSSPLKGRADVALDLEGVGTERVDLEKHLTGTGSLGMREGRTSGLGLSRAVFGDLSGLPPGVKDRLAVDEPLRDLAARFEVRAGRMELREPLAFAVDGSPVALGGAIGIFGDLHLDGTYELAARRLEQLTGGACKASRNPVIPVRITGPASRPQVRPDGGRIAAELAQACLLGKAGSVVDGLLGEGGARKAAEAKEQLEQEAAAKAAAAKAELDAQAARAKAEADRLKAEAEAKRKAAEEAAKKKAADEAKKLKKRLGF
ncbi:MAG TPA: AsmA family protein [Vulgatibacter sp.]|nr:AsmA family protein [Vulgatibacter sp.]